MVIYRGRVVLTSHFSPSNEGRKHELARFFRVWDLRAVVITFLLGVLIGVAVGYAARTLHVPGFVKCITFEIAVEGQCLACRCHRVEVWNHGNADGRSIGDAAGGLWIPSQPAAHEIAG